MKQQTVESTIQKKKNIVFIRCGHVPQTTRAHFRMVTVAISLCHQPWFSTLNFAASVVPRYSQERVLDLYVEILGFSSLLIQGIRGTSTTVLSRQSFAGLLCTGSSIRRTSQEAVKKRRRTTKRPYSRSIVGATLEVIQKKGRRNQYIMILRICMGG